MALPTLIRAVQRPGQALKKKSKRKDRCSTFQYPSFSSYPLPSLALRSALACHPPRRVCRVHNNGESPFSRCSLFGASALSSSHQPARARCFEQTDPGTWRGLLSSGDCSGYSMFLKLLAPGVWTKICSNLAPAIFATHIRRDRGAARAAPGE